DAGQRRRARLAQPALGPRRLRTLALGIPARLRLAGRRDPFPAPRLCPPGRPLARPERCAPRLACPKRLAEQDRTGGGVPPPPRRPAPLRRRRPARPARSIAQKGWPDRTGASPGRGAPRS